MKKKYRIRYEIMWAVIIIALILLPQLIGTVKLCLQIILPTLGKGDELHLLFEYSDTGYGSVDMEVSYPGRDANPLDEGDPLSVTMIRHVCQALDYTYADGRCRLTGTLSCDAGTY